MLRKKREGAFLETLTAVREVIFDVEADDHIKIQAIRDLLDNSAAGMVPYIPPEPEPEPVSVANPPTAIEFQKYLAELEETKKALAFSEQHAKTLVNLASVAREIKDKAVE